jgi:hemerythrin
MKKEDKNMEKLITMTDNLITGVEEMDKEHLELIEMINHVASLIKEGKKEEVKEFFINKFSAYIETHLKDEEKFMESIGYPELETHKKVHNI